MDEVTEDSDARAVAEHLDSLPALYDQSKVIALQNCIVDLAKANGANLMEFAYALKNVLLAVEVMLAEKSKEMGETRSFD